MESASSASGWPAAARRGHGLLEMRRQARIPTFHTWTDYLMAWIERRSSDMVLNMHTLGTLKIMDDPEAVFQDLRSRGHDITKVPPFSISSCATAVLVDPASGTRIAGADPRRDCYAMAY